MRTVAPATTRWCPTADQLMILEEMYRSGVRTPNASQIQQITAQLARYGRIEGKNVFYWFQNHKARERQKLRRRLLLSRHCQLFYPGAHHHHHQTTLVHFPHAQYSPIMASPPTFLFHDKQVDTTGGMDFFSENYTDASIGGSGDAEESNATGNCMDQRLAIMNVPYHCGGAAVESNAVRNCADRQSAMMHDLYHCGSGRPLKTLDLFPTMSTGCLKDTNNNNAEPTAGSKSSFSTTTIN